MKPTTVKTTNSIILWTALILFGVIAIISSAEVYVAYNRITELEKKMDENHQQITRIMDHLGRINAGVTFKNTRKMTERMDLCKEGKIACDEEERR